MTPYDTHLVVCAQDASWLAAGRAAIPPPPSSPSGGKSRDHRGALLPPDRAALLAHAQAKLDVAHYMWRLL